MGALSQSPQAISPLSRPVARLILASAVIRTNKFSENDKGVLGVQFDAYEKPKGRPDALLPVVPQLPQLAAIDLRARVADRTFRAYRSDRRHLRARHRAGRGEERATQK